MRFLSRRKKNDGSNQKTQRFYLLELEALELSTENKALK